MQSNIFSQARTSSIKPFLRWAGGKTWLINEINAILPPYLNNYHEPFLGGGSVFLSLKARDSISGFSYLSDMNTDLINAYEVLRDEPSALFEKLQMFSNDADCYYKVRSSDPIDSLNKAAKFIYLNRTSYNGIYRVNTSGQYNVPFGKRSLSVLFEFENMLSVSKLLSSSNFNSGDFSAALGKIKQKDFVFLDPPYTVAHENNGFLEYNQKIFAWEDQIRLRQFIDELNRIGAYFILTNAAHQSIEELYNGVGVKRAVSRYSTISGKMSGRNSCHEYIYYNF